MDIIESAQYFYLGVLICYIGQILDSYLKKSKRQQIISNERKLYFDKLIAESLSMEEEKSRIEANLIKNIEEAKRENGDIEEQLDDDVHSEWSSTEQADDEQELEALRNGVEELKAVEGSISEQSVHLEDSNIDKLNERIAQLEEDNRNLREQLDNHKEYHPELSDDTELDPELLKFLNAHKELTLEVLQQAHNLILEMKASDEFKNMDFNEFVQELRTTRVEYANKLAELRVAKRASEHKLEIAKKTYLEELRLFDESRTEYLLKRSVRQDYLNKLKESNQVRDDMIKDLEDELSRLRSEIGEWKNRYQTAEQQSSVYYKAYQDSLVKKERLEAERARVVSATSSFVDNIPPPPPVKIPTVDEMLQS